MFEGRLHSKSIKRRLDVAFVFLYLSVALLTRLASTDYVPASTHTHTTLPHTHLERP